MWHEAVAGNPSLPSDHRCLAYQEQKAWVRPPSCTWVATGQPRAAPVAAYPEPTLHQTGQRGGGQAQPSISELPEGRGRNCPTFAFSEGFKPQCTPWTGPGPSIVRQLLNAGERQLTQSLDNLSLPCPRPLAPLSSPMAATVQQLVRL